MNIKTVAEKAGVSVATASRVLNHPEAVSEKTKAHVLNVMKQLNYTPNWFARNIQTGKTNVIGLILPDILDPANMEIAKGVEDIANQKNCTVMVCNTEYDYEKEKEYVDMLISKKVDGIVLMSTILKKEDLDSIADKRTPYVLLGKNNQYTSSNLVYTDYADSTESAISYLIEMGRSNIGIALATNPEVEMKEKLKGYKHALKKEGLKFDKSFVAEGENSLEGGYLAVRELLNKNKKLDAVFAATDIMAFGVMERLKQKEIKIPEDVALIGYDDLSLGAVVEPKLTTISKPMYRMGLTAARLLFDNIEEEIEEAVNQEIILHSKLKVRRSCGNTDRLKEIW